MNQTLKMRISLLITGLLTCFTFFGCKKNESGCAPTDNYLLYFFIDKESRIATPDITDTTGFFVNVYKSNAGAKKPELVMNGHNIEMKDDGASRCSGGSHFESGSILVPNAMQAGYFLLGQSNNLKLTGDRCGTVNESFQLPNEIRMKHLPGGIIHRNSDVVLELTGTGDFPYPIPNNDDPTSLFDRITMQISYYRSISDTVTYPSLPAQSEFYGRSYQATNNGKFVIPSSDIQKFPLNGRVVLLIYRDTQFKLLNRSKGELFIQSDQQQKEFYIIKD